MKKTTFRYLTLCKKTWNSVLKYVKWVGQSLFNIQASRTIFELLIFFSIFYFSIVPISPNACMFGYGCPSRGTYFRRKYTENILFPERRGQWVFYYILSVKEVKKNTKNYHKMYIYLKFLTGKQNLGTAEFLFTGYPPLVSCYIEI